MKLFLMIAVPTFIPFISWIPAKFWIYSGEPWCLKVYPEWLDRFIYNLVEKYLDKDIGEAAIQMEFIETYIATVIILEIFALCLFIAFRRVFDEEHPYL